MTIIFRYFWLLLAGVMLLNITIWRKRLAPLIDRGTVTKVEVERFVKWAGVGGAIAWRTMPRSPEFDCPALPTTT